MGQCQEEMSCALLAGFTARLLCSCFSCFSPAVVLSWRAGEGQGRAWRSDSGFLSRRRGCPFFRLLIAHNVRLRSVRNPKLRRRSEGPVAALEIVFFFLVLLSLMKVYVWKIRLLFFCSCDNLSPATTSLLRQPLSTKKRLNGTHVCFGDN